MEEIVLKNNNKLQRLWSLCNTKIWSEFPRFNNIKMFHLWIWNLESINKLDKLKKEVLTL